MKLVTFERNGSRSAGALVQNRVVHLSAAYAAYLAARPSSPDHLPSLPDSMIDLLGLGDAGMAAARQAVEFAVSSGAGAEGLAGEPLSVPLDLVRLAAPIPRPGKIICIGLTPGITPRR